MSSHYGTCPICHGTKDELGTIGGRVGCGHKMCRECIGEWLKVENRCPMCRKSFYRVDFPLTPTIRIHEDKRQEVSRGYMNEYDSDGYTDDSDDTDESQREKERAQAELALCSKCGTDENPEKLLLCDNLYCYKACHTYCCDPPLRRIPSHGWLCPRCNVEESSSEDEVERHISSRTRGVGRRDLPDVESEWSECETTPHSGCSWSPSSDE